MSGDIRRVTFINQQQSTCVRDSKGSGRRVHWPQKNVLRTVEWLRYFSDSCRWSIPGSYESTYIQHLALPLVHKSLESETFVID